MSKVYAACEPDLLQICLKKEKEKKKMKLEKRVGKKERGKKKKFLLEPGVVTLHKSWLCLRIHVTAIQVSQSDSLLWLRSQVSCAIFPDGEFWPEVRL